MYAYSMDAAGAVIAWLLLLLHHLSTMQGSVLAVVYTSCPGAWSTDYCSVSFRTHCCYSACCASYQLMYTLKSCGRYTCHNYRSTSCCGYGYSSTCCGTTTYTSCTGSYYTDQCTDYKSTLCCFHKCCDEKDQRYSFSTCGTSLCTDPDLKYCCKPSKCCGRASWLSSRSTSYTYDSGYSLDATTIIVPIAVAILVTIVIVVIVAVMCAKRSAARRGPRAIGGPLSTGPRVAGAGPLQPQGVPASRVPMLPASQPAPAAAQPYMYPSNPSTVPYFATVSTGAPPSYDAAMDMNQGMKMSDLRTGPAEGTGPSAPYM